MNHRVSPPLDPKSYFYKDFGKEKKEKGDLLSSC